MIAFATLLLGLVVGVQPVEVLVGSDVASVELLLDGQRVASLVSPTWSADCDFGPRLEPHRLVAVARDDKENEIGRVSQWINLPRRAAEASVAIEGAARGQGAVAILSWESVVDSDPTEVRASLDGRPLVVRDPRRIPLPPFDPDRLHHFRAELDFPDNVTSSVDLTFAGSYADRIRTELTAVPVRFSRRSKLRGPGELEGVFAAGEETLRVVAVEEGPAELVVVRDDTARSDLAAMVRRDEKALWRRARGGGPVETGSVRTLVRLPSSVRLRFLWPRSRRQARSEYALDVFPPSPQFTSQDGGLFWLLSYVRQPTGSKEPSRFADAVAAAALLASERNRRRAVLLIVGSGGTSDRSSQFGIADVRRYLQNLGVPLVVWSTAPQPASAGAWKPATDVSSLQKLARAAEDLFSDLGRQRVVWIEGRLLPQTIRIAAPTRGIELIR